MPEMTVITNGCSSGVLHPQGRFKQIALATPKALERYIGDDLLRRRVSSVLAATEPAASFYGPTQITIFQARRPDVQKVALFQQQEGDPADYILFMQARRSLIEGENPRVILEILGIQTTESIGQLSRLQYRALVAEIKGTDYGGWREIAAVDCRPDSVFHQAERRDDGWHIVFSPRLLSMREEKELLEL